MKNIFKYRLFLSIILSLLFIALIVFSLLNVKLNPSLYNFLPHNDKLQKSANLSANSFNADKVILYIKTDDTKNLQKYIIAIDMILSESKIKFKNALPQEKDIKEIMQYAENNAMLLYPYEYKENPFSKNEISKRLKIKEEYFLSIPFFNPSYSFFLDPLFLSSEVLSNAGEMNKGKYSTKYGGLISKEGNSYIKILKAGFFPENYVLNKELKKIDEKIFKYSKENGINAFLLSSHLYFLESNNTIQKDVALIFILSIIITLLIFYYFFKDILLLFYTFIPLAGGFALAFLSIALFKKEFSAIALGFGSTSIGVAIDYSIHYLVKKDLYKTLPLVRKKIGSSLFLGFITTIISFILLPFSGIKSLNEIAVFGAVSIFFSYLFSWFFLQNILPPHDFELKIKPVNIRFLGKKGFNIWLVLIFISLVFLPFLRFEDSLLDLDMNHKELNKKASLILKDFSESNDNIFLSFRGKTRDEALFKSLYALYELKKNPDNPLFFTPALLYPPQGVISERKMYIKKNFNINIFNDGVRDTIFDESYYKDFLEMIKNIDRVEITDIPEYLKTEVESMFTKYNNEEYLLIPIYKRELSGKIGEALAKQNIDFEIIDLVKDGAGGLTAFSKLGIFLLLLSLILIFIILFFVYKNVLFAFTAVLPALSALIVCFAVTVIFRSDFNIMHFVASILLVGVGVDYGIFATNILTKKSSKKEIERTYLGTIISALTTIAGFGVLILCRHNSLFSLGSSMFFGIIFAFITSYLALPYLILKKAESKN